MPNFSKLFSAAKGEPLIYKGRPLRQVDVLPVKMGDRFRIVFEGAASAWRQAILLITARPIRVDGRGMNRLVVLWEDKGQRTVDVVIDIDGDLCIQNGWDTGNGVLKAGRSGAAMIVDETPTRRRYRCNDGYPDDDFDDLVFRIERVFL